MRDVNREVADRAVPHLFVQSVAGDGLGAAMVRLPLTGMDRLMSRDKSVDNRGEGCTHDYRSGRRLARS